MRISSIVAVALQAASVLATPGSVCYSGVYGALLPLAKYPPAQEFCSKHYPIPAVTVTAKARRHAQRSPGPIAEPDMPLAARTDPLDKLCDTLQKAAASIARTACSCIETTKTVTVKPTTKSTTQTTAKMTTTSKKTTPTSKLTTPKSTPTTTEPSTMPTTTPIVTTPAVTTPVITTPVVTTPIVTTPATTESSTTTSSAAAPTTTPPGGCIPSTSIIAVDGLPGGVAYLQNVDVPGVLLVTTDIASATLFTVGDGRITRCTATQDVYVGYGTGATFSEIYFNSEMPGNENTLLVGTSGSAVTFTDRANGNSIIADCFDQIYVVGPDNPLNGCRVVTLRVVT